MQRTVYSTKITYAKMEVDRDGNLLSHLDTIVIHETDEKKAIKQAVKKLGMFQPIKVEKISALYVLDDEIFFKYAKIQQDNTSTDTATDTANN